MAKYLMRFDDINSRMDWDKFFILKKCLEKYNIKSILGVVPSCKDDFLCVGQPIKNYYGHLKNFIKYGDSIAQHGYEHIYDSLEKGIFGNSPNSEFAGHDYEIQLKKLLLGKKILEKELIWEPIFMAPAHSFDSKTKLALNELGFSIVLDGFSLFPYKVNNLLFIPQISSRPLPKYLPCISQLCVHINTISISEINHLIKFIDKNHKRFLSLNEINGGRSKNKTELKLVTLIVKNIRFFKKTILLIKNFFLKSLCLYQRIYFRLKLKKFKVDPWHINGTFYCRKYKLFSLELINELKPKLYIDIGCGLGELLSRVDKNISYKIGYDKDINISKIHYELKSNKFKYFAKKTNLINYVRKLDISNKDLKVISMLNFAHNLNPKELKFLISFYSKNIGEFTLIIDSIFKKEIKYKYNHHNFLINHKGLKKYFYKVDNLRSIYFLRVN